MSQVDAMFREVTETNGVWPVSPVRHISLFAGAGGLDLGLEAAGMHGELITDIDSHSCRTLEANQLALRRRRSGIMQHAKIIQEDVRTLDGKTLLELTSLRRGELEVLAGGPPCQAFSVFGQRQGTSDPRGQLIYHYLRILGDLAPQSFILENVFGILSVDGGGVFDELVDKLARPRRGLKYELAVIRINAVDHGVPQFRDRVFIIGSRTGTNVKDIAATFGPPDSMLDNRLPWRTVRDALRGLPPIGEHDIANHVGRRHSQRIIDRYRGMAPGQRDSHTRINKLDLDRPSFTIIVGSDKGGGKGHIHPLEPREVTPRESARIQCFPDWWWFSGTSRHPIRQVGNAVPSLLGYAVGRAVIENVFGGQAKSWTDAINSLSQKHLFTSSELKALSRQDMAS